MPGKVTIKDVAALAGVSTSTVSRALNDDPRVSPEAMTSVKRASSMLGYTPNPAARSLKAGRTGLIGLVVLEPAARLFEDPYFGRLMRGVSEVLEAEGRQLVLVLRQTGAGEARLEADLARMHLDGVVLVSLHGSDRLLDVLLDRELPVVTVGRPLTVRPVSFVDVDNIGGAGLAIDHVVSRGNKVVATVAMPQDMASGIDRLAGYRQGLARNGLKRSAGLEYVGDLSYESGVAGATELMARRPDIDAIFVGAEVMGYGVLAGLQAAGLAVPHDVAVVSFDDSPPSARTAPPLTSVLQPVEEMATRVTRMLLERVDDPTLPVSSLVLPTTLTVRASTDPRALKLSRAGRSSGPARPARGRSV